MSSNAFAQCEQDFSIALDRQQSFRNPMLSIKLTASNLSDLSVMVTAYLTQFDPYIYETAAALQGFDKDASVFYAIMTRNEVPK